jgi:hypothetical protein
MSKTIEFAGKYEDIEELAGRLRKIATKRMGVKNPRARDLLDWIVDRLGGEVKVASSPSGVEGDSGSLVIRGKRDFTIWLSPYTGRLRDNFTIAHELAHYFLHFDSEEMKSGDAPVVFNRYGSDTFEWQANRFAASLLMPKMEFLEVYKKHGGNIYAVAGHFGVSEVAAEVRARYLVIDE